MARAVGFTSKASTWLTLGGMVGALHPRSRRASALCLLLVGLGYVGIVWERACKADLRNLKGVAGRSCDWYDRDQLLIHAAIAALGIRLIGGKGR